MHLGPTEEGKQLIAVPSLGGTPAALILMGRSLSPRDVPTPPDRFHSHFLGQIALNPSRCRSKRRPEWGRAARIARLWARPISPWFAFRRSIRKAIGPGQSCLMQCSSSWWCLSFPTPPFQLHGPSLTLSQSPGVSNKPPIIVCHRRRRRRLSLGVTWAVFPNFFTAFNGICHSLTMSTSGGLGWALPADPIQLFYEHNCLISTKASALCYVFLC